MLPENQQHLFRSMTQLVGGGPKVGHRAVLSGHWTILSLKTYDKLKMFLDLGHSSSLRRYGPGARPVKNHRFRSLFACLEWSDITQSFGCCRKMLWSIHGMKSKMSTSRVVNQTPKQTLTVLQCCEFPWPWFVQTGLCRLTIFDSQIVVMMGF